jgi:rare lipoprotein A (peptidoglycan hydrolase)
MNSLTFSTAAAAALLLVSCARPAYEQRGWASYVADQYAGCPTSSGEIYHPSGWTAAHHSLPFGTQVKVKNHQTGRAVNVTVNDRFPYYPGRVINVSAAAAQYLGIAPFQLADVTVTAKTIPGGGGYGAPPPQQSPAYSAAPLPNYNAAPPPSYGNASQPVYPNTPPPPMSTLTPPPAY